MASIRSERVLKVAHWSDTLFSFTTTRSPGFRFESGHFVMLGIDLGGKKLMRAYSIASPHYDDKLEFLSIKVPGGALTSRLQNIQPGEEVLVSDKPVGTLVIRDLNPGRNLYLFSTGTGLAPFMSIIQDPDTYEKFEKVVLIHGVRTVAELAYADFISEELPNHEFLGEEIRNKLVYYPTVTREDFRNHGRITHHINSGKLFADIGLPALDPATDRAMICGGAAMLSELSSMLDARGFAISQGVGEPGDYVIERAFVDK
ncbi:ferredoxin--NADP reductase [Allosphingosinicella humi]